MAWKRALKKTRLMVNSADNTSPDIIINGQKKLEEVVAFKDLGFLSPKMAAR